MSPIHKSGAFVQQCFASHPLCLGLKRLSLPDVIVLTCSSCRFQHHIRVRGMSMQRSVAGMVEPDPLEPLGCLERCSHEHLRSLRVVHMDVIGDALALRCTECRRVYTIDVAEFETHGR